MIRSWKNLITLNASVMFRDERGNRHRPKIAIFQTEDRDARKSSHVSRVSRVIIIFFPFRNRTECFTIVANRRNHVRTPTSFQREVYFSHDMRVERSCFLSVTRNTEKEVFKLLERNF